MHLHILQTTSRYRERTSTVLGVPAVRVIRVNELRPQHSVRCSSQGLTSSVPRYTHRTTAEVQDTALDSLETLNEPSTEASLVVVHMRECSSRDVRLHAVCTITSQCDVPSSDSACVIRCACSVYKVQWAIILGVEPVDTVEAHTRLITDWGWYAVQ